MYINFGRELMQFNNGPFFNYVPKYINRFHNVNLIKMKFVTNRN